MHEPGLEPFSTEETRLARRLLRWTDHGLVAIDAADIAMRAAAGRHGVARARSGTGRGSTWVLVGLVALLLISVALAAGAVLRQPPAPFQDATGDAFRAVVVRPVGNGADILLAAADGQERRLRHVTTADLGIDSRYAISGGSMGDEPMGEGWLELRAAGPADGDRSGLAPYGLNILIDLADPGRAPIVVLGNGLGSFGRWGPDGSWALYCAAMAGPSLASTPGPLDDPAGLPDCGMPRRYSTLSGGAVRVVRPDRGIASAIVVPHVQTFSGGPEVIWTADGTGFLARDPDEAAGLDGPFVWGVTPLDGGPFRPGAPALYYRGLDLNPSRPDLVDSNRWAMPPTSDDFTGGTLVSAQAAAGGGAIWHLLDHPVGSTPRVLLARLTGLRSVDSVRAYELPTGAAWFILSGDDTYVAIELGGPEGITSFVLARVGADGATVPAGPAIPGGVAGLVPATVADLWPSR